MKTVYLATGLLIISLAACNYGNEGYNNAAGYNESGAAYEEGAGNYAEGSNANYGATASANWPAGSRIVVDNGVTYRVGPDGTRVELGPDDSRIVVENGIRYRVDPGGTRVRINENGAVIDVDEPNVTVNTTTD